VHLKAGVGVYTTTHQLHADVQLAQADSTSLPSFDLAKYDLQSRVKSEVAWHYMEVATKALYAAQTNALVNKNNQGSMVLKLEFTSNGYVSAYSNECYVQSGVWSRTRAKFPSCAQSGATITLTNFDEFDSAHNLKIVLKVTNVNADNPSNVQVRLTLHPDSQTSSYPLFRRTSSVWENINQLPQYSSGTLNWYKMYSSTTMNGDAEVLSVSSSQIEIKLTYRSSYGLGNDYSPGAAQGFYYTYFEFVLPWLTINSCNTGQTTHISSFRTGGHSWNDTGCERRSATRFRLYYNAYYFERRLN
jgi:hypothetical protein